MSPSSVQAVPLAFLESEGQLVLEPLQVSATSHSPAAARHSVPALPAGCWQTALLPLQVSVVHTLPSLVHAVPFVLNVQVAEQHELTVPLAAPSSHCSEASIAPLPHCVYVTVIRTESTDAVWLPPEVCTAESAAPNPEPLMSDAVHESPHRSEELPYDTKVSVAGQPAMLFLSVVPIVPPFTIRMALSLIVPDVAFLYSHSTWMPWIRLFDGSEKPKPVHFRKWDASLLLENAAVE